MNLAVLSNINIDSLKMHLKNSSVDKIMFSGYNQYLRDLIDPNSFIFKEKIDYIFLHLDGEELLSNEIYSLKKHNVLKEIDTLVLAINKYLEQFPLTTFIISQINFPPFSFSTYIISSSTVETILSVEIKINKKLYEFSRKNKNIIIFDFKRIINFFGYSELYDDKYWYLGRIKYSYKGFEVLTKELLSLINAHKGKSKKVLILDIDNTLWGGIIGEDGINGIKLSEDEVGKCYRDFQKAIKSLKDIGVLLALCSKNNESDVMEVFAKHPMMVLKEDDFIIKKINWNNKVENIIEISDELNLGLDSFVFIDDNPVERNLIVTNLKQVSVPEFPDEITNLKKWFLSEIVYQFFPKISVSIEDTDKLNQYQRNIKRAKLSDKLDMDSFIESLEIELKVYINPDSIISRLSQLSQKTNQFNLTTKRYSENDIINFLQSSDFDVFALDYSDKFGKEGVIGELIVKLDRDVAKIELLLLSCRVIGRNIEFSFLSEVLKFLQKKGINKIQAEYFATGRNELVKDLYKICGFTETNSNRYSGELTVLLKTIAQKIQHKIELIPK